ncbi:TetR/AcrR family transcriptional regulator [Kribbella sp. NPDC048928]|uniref:TetR/AcrR family transcriptional regulator n=1 Tax=Kribbella sp. NPDC048928 TaxID=3364111 RepID=UPI00371217CF
MGRTRGFDVDEALSLAMDVFWRQGYEATSMQMLCQAMDLQPGSVYAAFGSKWDLFVAAVRTYMESVSAESVERINTAASGVQGLRDYFGALVDAMVDGRRRWGCLVTNSLVELTERHPELAGVFDQHLSNLRTSFAGALTRARAAGELRPGAGPESAAFLVAVVQGMNVMAKTHPGRDVLQAVADQAVAGLVRTR